MKALFQSLLSYFLTPGGLVVMGALDSSLVFFLPLGIDFVVIILSARHPELFWLYAPLATAGSVLGAGLTFWIGRKVGEHGLSKIDQPEAAEADPRAREPESGRERRGAGHHPAAVSVHRVRADERRLRVNAWSFFTTLAAVRLLRFGVESALAARYGRRVLWVMESPTFTVIIGVMIGLAVVGTLVSAVAVYRGSKNRRS